MAAEEPAAAASHRSDLGQAMRLVRFEASARPTLDLRIGFRRPQRVAVGQPQAEHGHRPALAPRPPEVGSRHRVEFGAARRATDAHHFPHRLWMSTTRLFVFTGVHDRLQAQRCRHGNRHRVGVGQRHEALNGRPSGTRPQAKPERRVSALRLAAPNNNGRRVSGSTPHHSRRMSNTRAVKCGPSRGGAG